MCLTNVNLYLIFSLTGIKTQIHFLTIDYDSQLSFCHGHTADMKPPSCIEMLNFYLWDLQELECDIFTSSSLSFFIFQILNPLRVVGRPSQAPGAGPALSVFIPLLEDK